ncbi:MAG TPA: carboxypeptidase-like regulatory domain-containing protein [Kofleriaceae bacterium]
MGIRALAALVIATGVAVLAAGPVNAAPTIDIRAQTSLSLEAVKLKDEGVAEVSGALVDRLTGDGIGGETVSITIHGQTVTANTQPDGKFRALIDVPPGTSEVELSFKGGALLEGSKAQQPADPARSQVTLAITVDDSTPDPTIVVKSVGDDATKLNVDISAGPATAPSLTALPSVQTGTPFTLTRKQVGGPGSKRVRATFPGDPTHQMAVAEATFELSTATRTSMRVSTLSLAYEDALVVSGMVIDDDGHPIPHASTTLQSGDRRLAQGATDDKGAYRFSIEGEIIGQGNYSVQVQSDVGLSFYKPSKSDPAIIKVNAPQPVPVSYTIAAFLATGLAAGGFFAARTKPWERLRRKAPAAEVPSNESPNEVADGGLVANRPSVMSTLRRPFDDGIAGVVRDTVRSRPVPEAVVSLVMGETERSIRTAADGSFALEKLTPGEWQAEVAGPGHVTERFTVTIPHRGELRGVRIDLVPVRERVFQLYRHAAEPALPDAKLWGVWSPRQIVDHVKSKKRSPAMSDLTDFVEEIYFSPRLAIETVLPQAKDRVERAIKERSAKVDNAPTRN